jgi:predicted RNase H-like HicB family nuclease
LTFNRNGDTYCDMKKKFQVTLLEHADGVSISCPALPGCHPQGATVKEAMANIEDAIHGYLELYGEPDLHCEIREMELVTG